MDQDLFDRRRAIERERVGSESPAGVVTADIHASWERCRTVLEIERPNVPVDDGDVVGAWDESPLRRLPPQILTQLVDSGRDAGMLTVVTDPAGQVLWASAPTGSRARRPTRRSRARWSLGRVCRRHQRHRHGPRDGSPGGRVRHRALVRAGP